MTSNLKPTFLVEHCFDCNTHAWNTRHDEAKYLRYAKAVEEAIRKAIPNLSNDQVLVNEFNYDLAMGGVVELNNG